MKYLLIIISLSFFTGYSQNKIDSTYIFSKYEDFDYEKYGDKVRMIVNENNEPLIIDFKNGRYISLKNNEINCYTTCNDTVINIVKLNKIEAENCSIYIDTLLSLNPKNIFDGIDESNAGKIIQDGAAFEITLFKHNKVLKLYSYSPYINTNKRFSSPPDAKSFLNCFIKLQKYFYDKEFERVKSLDTLYLFLTRGKNIQHAIHINKVKNTRQEDYFFTFRCISGQFTNLNISSHKEPINVFFTKKSFLKTHYDKIIYYDYLQKFTQCDLNQLISSTSKKIFIIDNDEKRGNKFKIKEAKGGTYCF